jgi:glycosidase
MVPTDFWNETRKELDKIKPVFMLAEWESPEMHEKAFDMSYSWDLFNIFNSIAKGEKNAKDLVEYFSKEKKEYPENAFRMRFTSNHDENSWNGTVFERLGAAAEIFAVLSCVVPGMPLLYNGQEAGLDKRLKFFEKDPIEWKDHKFFDIYKKLIHLKKENPVLMNGEKGGKMIKLSSDKDDKIFSFIRENNDDKILAVFNLSPSPVSFELNNEKPGSYRNLFTEETANLNKKEEINLESWGYMILVAQ